MATEKFHYETAGKKQVTLPKFGQIKAGLIRKVRKENTVEQMFSILEAVADEKTLDILDDLDTSELNELMAAWQKDSQVTPGESSASSTS